MPELPEVETIVKELNSAVRHRRIEQVVVFRHDLLGGVPAREFCGRLAGATILKVARQGKFLIFHLRPGLYLVAHLRMTGKFIRSQPLSAPGRHHRAWFRLDDGHLLVFQDPRCLGRLRVVERLAEDPSLSRLGIDPLSPRFTLHWLAGRLATSRSPIKHWLMDQTKLAGLGNIYAAEILFAAGISPLRPARELKDAAVQRLHAEVRRVLRQAVRLNGTTIRDFRRVDDKRGAFQDLLQVYGRAGDPCPVCRTAVRRIRQQQRSTYYCPSCQS